MGSCKSFLRKSEIIVILIFVPTYSISQFLKISITIEPKKTHYLVKILILIKDKFFLLTPLSIRFCVKKGKIRVQPLPKSSKINIYIIRFLCGFKYLKIYNKSSFFCLGISFLKKITVGLRKSAMPS